MTEIQELNLRKRISELEFEKEKLSLKCKYELETLKFRERIKDLSLDTNNKKYENLCEQNSEQKEINKVIFKLILENEWKFKNLNSEEIKKCPKEFSEDIEKQKRLYYEIRNIEEDKKK